MGSLLEVSVTEAYAAMDLAWSLPEDSEGPRDQLFRRVDDLDRLILLTPSTDEPAVRAKFGYLRWLRIDGPPVALEPSAAQGVAMVLHELATNAAKHGALSVEAGRVELTWRVEEPDQLRVLWMEREGPPVEAPKRQGFGVSVISRAMSGPVGGATTVQWLPTGLVCEIELPCKSPP